MRIGDKIMKEKKAITNATNAPLEYVRIKKYPNMQFTESTIQNIKRFLNAINPHDATISITIKAAVLLMLPAPSSNQSNLLSAPCVALTNIPILKGKVIRLKFRHICDQLKIKYAAVENSTSVALLIKYNFTIYFPLGGVPIGFITTLFCSFINVFTRKKLLSYSILENLKSSEVSTDSSLTESSPRFHINSLGKSTAGGAISRESVNLYFESLLSSVITINSFFAPLPCRQY